MMQTKQSRMVLMIVLIGCLWNFNGIIFAQPVFNVFMEPDTRVIEIKDVEKPIIEPQEILVIAQTDQPQVNWRLDGPGKLMGGQQNAGIMYVAPQQINGRSEIATITVTVNPDTGQAASKSITFTIRVPDNVILSSLPPLPAPPSPPATGYIQVVVNVPDVKVYINNTYVGTAQPLQPINYVGVPTDKKAIVKVELGDLTEFKVISVYPDQWTQVNFRLPDPMINELFAEAEQYFRDQYFLEPPGKNAFDLYRAILEIDPVNPDAREKLREMLTMLKTWADGDYRKQDYEKAKRYYGKYIVVAEYVLYTLRDTLIESDYQDVLKRYQ